MGSPGAQLIGNPNVGPFVEGALKSLLTLAPVMVVYAVIGARGLTAVCAEKKSFPNLWCEAGSVGYIVIAVILERFFYVWLKPREPKK